MDTNELHVHQFRETVVPPTCREPGYSIYTCDCGYEHKTNFTPITDHAFQVTQATPASCTAPGEITSVCATCGISTTRTLAPLGHQFSNWIVQKYPTCQEEGMRIRKCPRCDMQEESILPPTGHRPAPQTAQYVRGRMTSFFCENCGQTVVNAVPVEAPVIQQPGNHWPTKILLLIYAVFAVILLGLDAIMTLDGIEFSYPILEIGARILDISFGFFLFFATDKIKNSPRFPQWLGLFPAAVALVRVISFALVYSRYFAFDLNLILEILQIVPLLFLMFVFFCGAKRKKWLFITVLSCAACCILLRLPSLSSNLHWFITKPHLIRFYNVVLNTTIILRMVCWILLVTPAKNAPAHLPGNEPPAT